jgi:cytochrome P450
VVDLSDSRSFASGFPHDAFTWLRDNAPLFWHPPTGVTPDQEGFWVVSRYHDVAAVQRDPVAFSSETAGGRQGGGTGLKDEPVSGVALNATDDPRHRRLRALVNKGFTPKAVAKLEDELSRRMQALLAAVAGEEAFDFVGAVARELPLQTICSLLGVPQADRTQLVQWVDLALASDSPSIMDPVYIRRIRDYAVTLIAAKRDQPADDIFSTIVHARLDGDGSRLQDRELIAFFTLLFPAGAETTRSAMAGAVKAFIDFPEQYDRLRQDLSLMQAAGEEIIRWTTPSVYKRRTATCDRSMHGNTIRAGDKVTFWEMSANRDERYFDRPFEFDVARWPNKHLGFGAGVHFCLGASLARLELTVALRELIKRYRGFELAGDLEWVPNNRLLGLRKLEIRAESA